MAHPISVLSIKSMGVNIVPRFNVIDSYSFLPRLLRFSQMGQRCNSSIVSRISAEFNDLLQQLGIKYE